MKNMSNDKLKRAHYTVKRLRNKPPIRKHLFMLRFCILAKCLCTSECANYTSSTRKGLSMLLNIATRAAISYTARNILPMKKTPMLLNDVMRRLRYALSLDNSATISIFKLVDYTLEEEYLSNMMKREDEEGFLPCRDKTLAMFLDGLIIKKRGKREGVTPPVLASGERLSNNDILRKIKII